MTAPVNSSRAATNRFVPQQDADQTFPSVLVTGTLGAIISLAGVWLTALLAA